MYELAHHGFTHTSPTKLSRDEEEAELEKGLEILRSFDAEVTGLSLSLVGFQPEHRRAAGALRFHVLVELHEPRGFEGFFASELYGWSGRSVW